MFAGIMLEVPQRYRVRNPLFEEAVVAGTCLTIPNGKKLIVSLETCIIGNTVKPLLKSI